MIEIKNLCKSFDNNIVLDKLNLTIDNGKITALVGKNGAGKSTLIRILSGLYKADSGDVVINPDVKIGVLLGGDVNLYRNLTGLEIIEYFGKLHHLETEYIHNRIDTLDKILHLNSFISKQASTFSRGMKQKIALAVSIVHDPDMLFFDEPSTGMDIEASNDVINFIKYLKERKKTILIATHNIFEISDLSDSIAFLDNGTIKKKIKTHEFFDKCLPDEKSNYLINEIRGDI